MEIVLAAHSGLRWLVLLGLIAVAVWGLGRGREEAVPSWVRIVAGLFGLQILLGVVLYVLVPGWEFGSFIAIWHPLAMIAALGVFQVGIARAARELSPRTLGMFTIVSLVLILAAIPWERGMM